MFLFKNINKQENGTLKDSVDPIEIPQSAAVNSLKF